MAEQANQGETPSAEKAGARREEILRETTGRDAKIPLPEGNHPIVVPVQRRWPITGGAYFDLQPKSGLR